MVVVSDATGVQCAVLNSGPVAEAIIGTERSRKDQTSDATPQPNFSRLAYLLLLYLSRDRHSLYNQDERWPQFHPRYGLV